MKIDPSAFDSLELKKIFSIIRRDCRTDLGESRLSSVVPAKDHDELVERRDVFNAVERYRDKHGDLPWDRRLSSIAPYLDECRETGMMSGAELLRVRRSLDVAQRVKEAMQSARDDLPALGYLIRKIRSFDAEIEALSCVEDDGRLADDASDRLRRLRERIRSLRETIRRKGNAILGDPSTSSMLQERVLTMRGGRHAVLVRADAIAGFPGLVMDRSSSGNSIYMEPHILVPLNNEHALLTDDERTEEHRILLKLTEKILSREEAVREVEEVLGEIDLFYALSEKMRRDKWRVPLVSRAAMFDLRSARHPMLGDAAVPINVECGEKFRALVITGPNTGGKTVALKTAGVCAALAWYGWPIPASDGSIVGDIGEIFSDIGDEQSIEQNLSTFSAHIKQICRITDAAGPSSLALLDELGAGTDPDEGAAIGIAVLDRLRECGSLVLATTHHNPIKHYSLTTEGVGSASVEFNAATLSPTYRLLIGIPGRSNALLIAERLGMRPDMIARAREALQGKEVSMEDIIGELHEKRAAIEQENASLDATRREVERAKAEYERELRELSARRDKVIADADKKALGIVTNAEQSAKSLLRTIEAESRAAANRKYEKTKKHFGTIRDSAQKREDDRAQREHAPSDVPLAPGDAVVVIGSSTYATLESITGDNAEISAGAARITLPLNMLRRATGEENKSERKSLRAGRKSDITVHLADGAPSVRINAPKAPTGVPSSIMVRGMTTDEAMPMVEQYIDKAYRAGYGEVTVIHGRGEGILRREIHSLCNHLPYVANYRLGEPGEGGHGVTVIRFK